MGKMEVIFVILAILSLKWYMIHEFLKKNYLTSLVTFTGVDDRS